MPPQKLLPLFTYGRPVRGEQFINRTDELREVLNRIYNGDSTAVVGEPHIGKTSFLLRLSDPKVLQNHFEDREKDFIFNFLNLHEVPFSYSPEQFWLESLQPLIEHPGNIGLSQCLQKAQKSSYSRPEMNALFKKISASGKTLVLLLDEFERLLEHPNFKDPSFFALLRSISSTVGGLVIVVASRITLDEMNRRGKKMLDTGSPLFNNMIEVRLKPFDNDAIKTFFENCGNTGFTVNDILFIRRVAGRHPFLLQGMSASLFNSKKDDRYACAAENFYEGQRSHFSDLWGALDASTRTTATILTVLEFGGRALGKDFSYGEIENVEKFGPYLRKLLEQGLAEKIGDNWEFDQEHILIWRGERWTVGSQAFAWWIRDSVILGSQDIPDVHNWLYNQSYSGLLTQKQWDDLISLVKKAPDWAVRGVGNLARTLFDELLRKHR